jgi:uncharacterized protein YdhG (YjbR/CyaY superfamily)
MAKTDFKNADEYLATFPPETRKILETVRKAIRAAVPKAEEVISYQIPAFKLDGGWIFYYSGYKAHYALACPPPFAAFKAFAKELAGYKSSISAVQFPYDQPVPTGLITRMAKHQAEENAKRAKSAGASKKPVVKNMVKKVAKKGPKKAVKKVVKKSAARK